MMSARIDYAKAAPGVVKAMSGLEQYLASCGLEPALLDLVRLRASYLNGCAYCIDMHSKDLRASGDSEQRVYGLVAWQEAPYYTERERAALHWTDAVTQIAAEHVPDDIYARAREQFSEQELVNLTLAIIAINGWNRLAISFRKEPGTYQPAHHTT
jgi:AhpD family alkylhydroperoxidase